MNLIEDAIENKGLKMSWLAKQIGVSSRTLTNWVNYENLNQVEKFTKLLTILELPLVEVAEEIYKKKDKE